MPKLKGKGIEVSLFIDPAHAQIEAAAQSGATFIELHTGTYANAIKEADVARTFQQLEKGTLQALSLGLRVNAGHGLNYRNVIAVARIAQMEELNIGHAIVARAIFAGMREAVREMKNLVC